MQYEKDIVPIIQLHYDSLSPVEKTVADFFMKNKTQMDFSAKNIAEHLFTSEATLSRFAQKCGFQGYRQFVFQYRECLVPKEAGQMGEDSRHILDTYQELLTHSYALLDEAQIHRVAKWIANKKRIFLYGKGSSGVSGEEMRLRLMRLGIDVDCIVDEHVMTMNSAIVNQDSLVIGISVSGKSTVVLHALQTAKLKGATTVLISSIHDKSWNDFCDEVLPIATKEKLDLGKLISPQYPILILFDLLYASVLQYDRNIKEALHSMTLAELNSVAPAQYMKEIQNMSHI